MTTSAAEQPLIPQPPTTVTALRQAVAQISPAALPSFTRELDQAADQSRQGSDLAPLQRFIAQWAVFVHIQRQPQLAEELRRWEDTRLEQNGGHNVSAEVLDAIAAFGDFGALPPAERNLVRLVFLDPATAELYGEWECRACEVVSNLRVYAGQHPDDEQLSALVGELSVKNEEFRRLWAAHTVADKTHGGKYLRHPLVGEMHLSFETLTLPDDPAQSLVTFHAAPGSASADALRLLASWDARTAVQALARAAERPPARPAAAGVPGPVPGRGAGPATA